MVQNMIDELNEAMADAVKSDNGNNAAMTRVRKAMQSAKGAAQDVRMKISSIRNG
ncbi:MAG TPA: histone H1 [Candidatus Poseidoniales archaeon]|nr:MAG TPA: histone H1 [Candidatus Poseidoniales archaeon]DAC25034.1 MAG TPA: histone H1 [Candidatus Poseidoniales archaeon]DAC42783.1 MAG TPA: histone H1 [Candidatus Poseidoniales archaeon]HII52879.1 histone H1 [Candidatus Thalassarchaeaceae archaeon]HII90419.1 histone H1 [Candidatus Thalassarchaeaceae archaeon]